jgi:Na+/proline symporter
LQTYLTAKNVKEARASLWFNGLVLKPLSLMFPLLGVMIFVYFREHPAARASLRTADDALPVFIMNVLPAGARGLAIAGIMSAMLTTFQSGITALAACTQVDYIQRWRRQTLAPSAAVLLGRCLMSGWSAVIVLIALFVLRLGRQNSIIQILNILMYPFSGVLLGIFLLGLLTKRATPGATLGGAAAGFVITASIAVLQLPVSNFYYGAIATLATFAAGYAASLWPPVSASQKRIEDLTHALL